jgi:GGDEF domain-containing protein
MNRLRLWCALLFLWLFVLYNTERLHEPINIASFVYVLAAAIAVPVILVPRLQRIPIAWSLASVVPVIVLAKFFLSYPIAHRHLPITITEIVAVWITIATAREMGRSLEELRQAAIKTLLTHLHYRTRPFDLGQAEIYREIRRARKFERPLSVLAIAPSASSLHLSLDRFTLELQRDCVQNYVFARVAELLSREMKDCDILAHESSHFITVLPEAGRETALATASRLQQLAHDRLGIDLQVGVSVFPDEEVTFVKLLERAQAELRGPNDRQTTPQADDGHEAACQLAGMSEIHDVCDDVELA